MSHPLYEARFKTDIQILISLSRELESVKYQGRRGAYREEALGTILKKYLPFGWDIGSGEIIDSFGRHSSETDLLVFNKAAIPPLLYTEGNHGCFPIESCKIAFEIKTKSSVKEIRSTIKKFKKLNQLQVANCKQENRPIRVYFAYGSDLKQDSSNTDELKRYLKEEEKDNEYHDNNPTISVLCIIGQGLWFHKHKTNESKWLFVDPKNNNFELLEFFKSFIQAMNPEYSFNSYFIDSIYSTIPVYYHDYESGILINTKKDMNLLCQAEEDYCNCKKTDIECLNKVLESLSKINQINEYQIAFRIYKLGLNAHSCQQYEKATLYFDKALEIDNSKSLENNWNLWATKGNCQYRIAQNTNDMNDLNSSICSFKKAVGLDRTDSKSYYFLSEIYYNLSLKNNDRNLLDKAVDYIDTALDRNPNDFRLLHDKGCMYFNLGKRAKASGDEKFTDFLNIARTTCVKALEKFPNELNLRHYLGLVEEELR